MKALASERTGIQNIKITPEFFLIFVPLTFTAGNWYLSSFGYIFVFAFIFLRYLTFKGSEITIPRLFPWLMIFLWGLYVVYITPDPVVAVKYYTALFIIPFIIFIVFDNIKISDKVLTAFVDSLLISGVILGLFSIYIYIIYDMREGMRVPSLWNDFNMVAAYFMILFMFNLSFILNTERGAKKIFYYFTLFIILFGIYLTKTRGVWMAVVISILIFFFKRPKIIIPSVVFFGLVTILFYDIIQDRIISIAYFEQDKSSVGRLQAWYSTVLLIFQNPWFGYGFDTYYLFRDEVMTNFIVDVPHPHNTYLRAIQEMGMIGAVIYLFLIFKAVFYSFNFKNYISNPSYKKYVNGAQLSLVGLLIAFNFEPYLSLFGVTTIAIWTIVALIFRLRKDAGEAGFSVNNPA